MHRAILPHNLAKAVPARVPVDRRRADQAGPVLQIRANREDNIRESVVCCVMAQ